jgi:hypothetical protein
VGRRHRMEPTPCWFRSRTECIRAGSGCDVRSEHLGQPCFCCSGPSSSKSVTLFECSSTKPDPTEPALRNAERMGQPSTCTTDERRQRRSVFVFRCVDLLDTCSQERRRIWRHLELFQVIITRHVAILYRKSTSPIIQLFPLTQRPTHHYAQELQRTASTRNLSSIKDDNKIHSQQKGQCGGLY